MNYTDPWGETLVDSNGNEIKVQDIREQANYLNIGFGRSGRYSEDKTGREELAALVKKAKAEGWRNSETTQQITDMFLLRYGAQEGAQNRYGYKYITTEEDLQKATEEWDAVQGYLCAQHQINQAWDQAPDRLGYKPSYTYALFEETPRKLRQFKEGAYKDELGNKLALLKQKYDEMADAISLAVQGSLPGGGAGGPTAPGHSLGEYRGVGEGGQEIQAVLGRGERMEREVEETTGWTTSTVLRAYAEGKAMEIGFASGGAMLGGLKRATSRAAKEATKGLEGGWSFLSKETGSYHIEFESGKFYDGKGPYSRALESAREKTAAYGDKVVKIDWKPAPSTSEAFKHEALRIRSHGGIANPDSYNKINSPGERLLRKEGK